MSLLPWQSDIWQDLVQRHQAQGLPHALLLSGSSGIGKHQLALALAEWLLCQNPSEVACGQCHSCQLWKAGNHPDFMLCQPEDNSRQIKIDAVRKLNHFIYQTPQISRCQVVVMKPIEVMNTNAANALLKTLEEPAGESFLLLETERFGSVLPTIRSRCQKINLVTPSHVASSDWLQKQGYSQEQVELALQRNAFAPVKAKNWIESDQLTIQENWLAMLRSWSHDEIKLDVITSAFAKLEFDQVLTWFLDISLDMLKVLSAGEVASSHCQFGSAAQHLAEGRQINKIALIDFQKRVQAILGQLLSGVSSQNKTLTIELLLIEWHKLMKLDSRAV